MTIRRLKAELSLAGDAGNWRLLYNTGHTISKGGKTLQFLRWEIFDALQKQLFRSKEFASNFAGEYGASK
jgi:hypothetical protein